MLEEFFNNLENNVYFYSFMLAFGTTRASEKMYYYILKSLGK
jgi:hypothetical protein